MKNYIFILFSLSLSILHAQKTTNKKPAAKTVMHHDLRNFNDSFSYAIGINMASLFERQGIKDYNPELLFKAIKDYQIKKPGLNEEQANLVIMEKFDPKLSANIKKGQEFLELNKHKPEIKSTPSGLQYEILTLGKGPKPGPSDTIVVNYKGTLIDGKEFDNSYTRNQPLSISLNQVIHGWTEGFQLMPVGSKFKLYIPYQLGYGMNNQGAIPGGSTLIFDIEFLDIKGK